AADGIRAGHVTGVQTCALPILIGLQLIVADIEPGEKAIWQDLRARLYVSDNELKADYARSPAPMRRLMDAWADGLNYFLSTHPRSGERRVGKEVRSSWARSEDR